MNFSQNTMMRPNKMNKFVIIIFMSCFIFGNAAVSYNNGTNFQVEMLEPGGFRITSLQPGPISSQAMGRGSNYILNCYENGKMVIYAWMRSGGTLLVSSANHHLKITVDNNLQYKIEEDPY
jgi:hypothetical protein